MPVISRFFGIVIAMYYEDHCPPHFHAKYGDYEGVFNIHTLELISGKLPKKVLSLVIEWAFEKREDLLKNWELSIAGKPLSYISPLE